MINKENICPPKKQGILYAISTGKNNGVYLPNDIACQNHNSIKLLTKDAQDAHKSFVKTLRLVEKQKQCEMQYHKNIQQVDSFNEIYTFSLKQLSSMKVTVGQTGHLCKALRIQLQKVKENIMKQNAQLEQSALPALKSLKQKIKDYKNEQIANYSKMKRELQKVQQCFSIVQNGIKECERKIDHCQHNYKGPHAQH